MSAFWRPLISISNEPGVPPLLVKHDFGAANYTIYVTDLTYMWVETLERKQIVKRALNLETSIDPSEDKSQMQLLLRHVRESLEGHEDTGITIEGEGDADKLVLTSLITLPSPLLPLEWPFHLAKASQATFTSHFVLPSLSLFSVSKTQITSLLQHLKEKDNVINKLTDRIHSEGGDLGKIFPAVPSSRAGAKHNAKETAAKSVKGLANFDEKRWRSQVSSTKETDSNDVNALIATVFDAGDVDMHVFRQSAGGSEWWRKLGSDDDRPVKSKVKASEQSLTMKTPNAKLRIYSGDRSEFQVGSSHSHQSLLRLKKMQRQPTPPLLQVDTNREVTQSPADLRALTQDHGDSTTDESDNDHSTRASAVATKQRPKKTFDVAVRPNRKLQSARSSPSTQGMTRQSKSRTPDVALDEVSLSASTATLDSPTQQATFADSAATKSKPSDFVAADYVEPSSLAKPKRKLGKIGGKSKPEESKVEGRGSSQLHDEETSVRKPATETSAAGAINSNGKSSRTAQALPTTAQPDQPSSKEVSEEQANENRKRLQRELENSSKAGNRKKRKF